MARILVVDDDSDLRAIAKAVLQSVPHDVFLAESGHEAFHLMENETFDLIITDANMPKISGFELIRRVKSKPELRKIPIALLTARRDRDDIEKAMQLGVDDYIVKPLDPLIFLKKIDNLLQRPQADQNLLRVVFGEEEVPSDVMIPVKGHIFSLSEIGIQVQTNYPLVVSERIQLNTNLFRTIGINLPTLKVAAVQESQKVGVWVIDMHFVGLGDSTLQKIRAWIQQRHTRSKGRAA